MKPLLLASAVILTSWTSTPALAQETNWTGAYFGGRLGYSSQPNDNDETILFDNDLDGEYMEEPIDLGTWLVEHPAASYVMRVDGHSMSEAGINDGDLIVVSRSKWP